MVALLLAWTTEAVEVLKNHDMEVTHFSNTDWKCQGGCTLTTSKEHYSGYHSVKVTNR